MFESQTKCTLFTIAHFSFVVFRQIAPEELNFCGSNFSRFLAVANFANINSGEYYCPVGYIPRIPVIPIVMLSCTNRL